MSYIFDGLNRVKSNDGETKPKKKYSKNPNNWKQCIFNDNETNERC